MSDIRCAVLTFAARSGTGTQTVTGVQDALGSFTGKLFIFQSAYAAMNVVTAGNVAFPWYADFRGVDTGSVRSSLVVADAYSPFNFKAVAGYLSFGDYSLLDCFASNFGTPINNRLAKISAIRSGEFDITYAQNDRNGDSILVTVFGGDDIDFTFTNYINGTYTTPSKPQGVLALSVPGPNASGGTSGGVGGQSIAWGFATRDGVYGTTALNVVNQGNNWSAQRTDGWTSQLDPTTGVQSTRPTISAWGDTSFTIANGGVSATTPMAISGANVRCAGGTITQPITAIAQQIDVGFAVKWIGFWSTGYPVDTATQGPVGQVSMGWATGVTAQIGFWSGDKTNGNVSPSYGARYQSSNSVIRFATPAGATTAFHSVAAVTAITPEDGTVDLDWPVVDGTAREVLWFAIGEASPEPPTPTYHTRTLVRRRVRRSPILWNEKQGLQTQVRVNLIAVDMQPGVGTSDTPEPLVMVRASKDGGRTWGNERLLKAGRVGEYTKRLNAWRWGQGRQWVVEVSTSDPVTFNLVQLLIDAEPGNA